MAVTFASPDADDRITLSATPDEVTAVTFDQNTRTYTIIGRDAAGTSGASVKVAQTGTDGAAIGTDYITVDGGARIEISRGKDRKLGGATVYIASSTASAIVEIRASSSIGG